MFFSSFLIFMIALVAGMIVSSNYGLFLVFHVWVSIVVIGVGVNFLGSIFISCLALRMTTRIYQCITNNHASFYLW